MASRVAALDTGAGRLRRLTVGDKRDEQRIAEVRSQVATLL